MKEWGESTPSFCCCASAVFSGKWGLTFPCRCSTSVQAINPIEMVMEATAMIQKRFYEDYPPHPKEKEYNYKCSSTMKPTQMSVRL